MSEVRKPFYKKNQIKKLKKKQNQCQKAACEQKINSEKKKFSSTKKLGLELTMKGLRKPFRKKINPKTEKKTVKSKWNCRI